MGLDKPRWRMSMRAIKRVAEEAVELMHEMMLAVIRSTCELKSGDSRRAKSAASSWPGSARYSSDLGGGNRTKIRNRSGKVDECVSLKLPKEVKRGT